MNTPKDHANRCSPGATSERLRATTLAAVFAAHLLLAACSGGTPARQLDDRSMRGVAASERFAAARADRLQQHRPPGVSPRSIDYAAEIVPRSGAPGFRITNGSVERQLVEAAGAVVLEQAVLERLLHERCAQLGLVVDQDLIDQERRLVIETLLASAEGRPELTPGPLDEDQAERLLTELRRRRGLGPARFDAFLRRSAMLRALVQDEVVVEERQINLVYALRHGPRHRIRIITADSLADVLAAVDEIDGGTPFAQVAQRRSTDASAPAGGRIQPISPVDPLIPAALRRAVVDLAEQEAFGQITDPVRLDAGYAIAILDETEDADGADPDDVRPELQRIVRRRQERLLMQELTTQLLDGVDVRPLTAPWRWAWLARPNAERVGPDSVP